MANYYRGYPGKMALATLSKWVLAPMSDDFANEREMESNIRKR